LWWKDVFFLAIGRIEVQILKLKDTTTVKDGKKKRKEEGMKE